MMENLGQHFRLLDNFCRVSKHGAKAIGGAADGRTRLAVAAGRHTPNDSI